MSLRDCAFEILAALNVRVPHGPRVAIAVLPAWPLSEGPVLCASSHWWLGLVLARAGVEAHSLGYAAHSLAQHCMPGVKFAFPLLSQGPRWSCVCTIIFLGFPQGSLLCSRVHVVFRWAAAFQIYECTSDLKRHYMVEP